MVNYNDECLAGFHRARTKQHLVIHEAIYILFYQPTLCKQNRKDCLKLIEDNCCLSRGGFNEFFLQCVHLFVSVRKLLLPHLFKREGFSTITEKIDFDRQQMIVIMEGGREPSHITLTCPKKTATQSEEQPSWNSNKTKYTISNQIWSKEGW